MDNEMIAQPEKMQEVMPVVQFADQTAESTQIQSYPEYYDERTSKLVDEVIAAVKDDRINTKRAISAEIAAMAWVQNQNDRVIAACEHELSRRDLPEERRAELINTMRIAAESTAYESVASREFKEKHLGRSHKLSRKIIVCIALIIVFGIVGAAKGRADK